jgi:hypothetical protein
MNNINKYGPVLVMLLLASTVMLLKGCGGNPDGAKLAGCPSGSLLANTGDSLSVSPGSVTTSAIVFTGSAANTVGIPVVPLVYQVMGVGGDPRNKVCVKLYTNGTFWDSNYAVAQSNPLTVATDAGGIATVYWSTAPLVTSMTASAGSPPTPGADSGPYRSFINAYSGPVLNLYTNDVTVSGCPAVLLGICP